ncbi:MAG: pirin family protein [Chitinophagaceae bacterium]
MSSFRSIQNITSSQSIKLGDHLVYQAIPTPGFPQISPFILLHHFDFEIEAGDNSFNVPAHPHRGFCPITFMYNGEIEHNDSLGNNAVIGDNEVQWINAGRGIIHSEKIGKAFAEKGGRYQGIQLWINLTAAQKMLPPSYQPITQDEIPMLERNGVTIRLVSGNFMGVAGPADSNALTAMVRMVADAEFEFSLSASQNVGVYVLEGNLLVNQEKSAGQHQLISFKKEERPVFLKANPSATLLLIAGEPINEPLVSHGPFVMNNQTEVLEAMRDYQDGKMGFLY